MTGTTKGIICIISSSFCFALMAFFVRLAGDINFVQKAFFRNSAAFLIALFLIVKDVLRNGKSALAVPGGAVLFLFLRAASGTVGIFGNFYAIDHLVLSDAAILNKMSPFFAVIFSCILMKEKVRPVSLIIILAAFAGSFFVVKPSLDFSKSLPAMAGLAGGMGAGFAYSCVRKLSTMRCGSHIVVLFFCCFSMLVSLPFMAGNFEPMSLRQVLLLAAAGVSAAGGQFGITAAYFAAPAREISIYDYSQIIFSAVLGFVFFGQVPDSWSVAGYSVIILMAVLNFIYAGRKSGADGKTHC